MAEKIDKASSYGMKLLGLFARLLFTKEPLSLIDLSRNMRCSKQTVLRLVDDIRRSYRVDIEESLEGKRRYYRIKTEREMPKSIPMTGLEMNVLLMCRAFTEHLLGRPLFEEATRGLEKGMALVPKDAPLSAGHYASFRPGSIDYGPHRQKIEALMDAMNQGLIARIAYKSPSTEKANVFYLKPFKLFSRNETLYLHGRMATAPDRPRSFEPDFDPLLAVHRIQQVEVTTRRFKVPPDYDFDALFNREYGVIKDMPFRVEVEFTGFAAIFVAERIWSPDQKIVKKRDGCIRLAFSASSEPEVLSWVLSFGEEARLIKPKRLVKKIKERVREMVNLYQSQQ